MKDSDNYYDELTAQWDGLLEIIRCEAVDLDAFKHLIFDTYLFIKNDFKGDSIPRNRLELYKYICQVSYSLSTEYAIGIRQSESHVLHACTMGLEFAVENGCVGYSDNPLIIGLNSIQSGFYIPEADMTTYESFDKDFNKHVEQWREYYNEDEE